jgi:acetylornithine deacetylase/succinyl-diaminopimelate desuccinylase-like protein
MSDTAAAQSYARSRRGATLDRLHRLLEYPTVSAEPRHAKDMNACAASLARTLGHIGLRDVRICPGRVAPVVTASWQGRREGPTVLVYGHYDVQPVEPKNAWTTEPFRPTRRGQYLYARGASDDKGQLMAHLAAIEAWLTTSGKLPVNLRLILDGEEEIGSPTLLEAVARRWPPLFADVAVVSDTWMLAPDAPVLISGLRGVLGARLEMTGPARDLHAGAFGGAVANPAEALAGLVASLHDKTGRVSISGFYENVRPLREKERLRLGRTGPSDRAMLAPAGVMNSYGEPGFSAFERAVRRPAVVVADLQTSGEGRTVVPARAGADLNIRLVDGQEPENVIRLLRRHLHSRIPPGVRGKLVIRSRCPAYKLREDTAALRAARSACRSVYGREPVLLPSGGSIPFVSALAASCPIEVLLLGFGLRDDAIHAPNERLYLPNLYRGTKVCIELYEQLGGVPIA